MLQKIRSFLNPYPGLEAITSGEASGMVSLHAEGLARVNCVIDGAPHYDILLRGRLSQRDLDQFAPDVPIDTKRAWAIERAERALETPAKQILQPRFEGVACYGSARNNLREFNFFDALCDPVGLSLKGHNYSVDGSRTKTCRPGRRERMILAALRADIRRFYSQRTAISAGLVHQQISFSKWFFNHLRSFTMPDAKLPAAIVLANDHWPSLVALSMVMKGLGVPRIYLQHAEVSLIFPPLDFEYSILRNQHSLEIYRKIAPLQGQCFVIARELVQPPFERLAQAIDEPQSVVIYPTARIVMEDLHRIVLALVENPRVRDVRIKRHPRCDNLPAGRFLDSHSEVVDAMPTHDHFAIVGNSSIVIELLARGIPVCQNFDFDPGEPDYYGFIRAGLCREAPFEMLSQDFLQPIQTDDAWRAEFARWVPDAISTEKETRRFRDEMVKVASRL